MQPLIVSSWDEVLDDDGCACDGRDLPGGKASLLDMTRWRAPGGSVVHWVT